MSTETDRLKAIRAVLRAQLTRTVNKAQVTLGTEPIYVLKLHALLEWLISGNGELPTINEQLYPGVSLAELEEAYEAALRYSKRVAGQVTRDAGTNGGSNRSEFCASRGGEARSACSFSEVKFLKHKWIMFARVRATCLQRKLQPMIVALVKNITLQFILSKKWVLPFLTRGRNVTVSYIASEREKQFLPIRVAQNFSPPYGMRRAPYWTKRPTLFTGEIVLRMGQNLHPLSTGRILLRIWRNMLSFSRRKFSFPFWFASEKTKSPSSPRRMQSRL